VFLAAHRTPYRDVQVPVDQVTRVGKVPLPAVFRS